jgi:D-arabinose 1-dehydrogenase-like Zn-dependent alcohol dehydrogenase
MTKLDDYRQVAEGYPLPRTMEAVVLRGNDEGDLNLVRVMVPECGDSQLLSRVDAAVACASDNKHADQGSDRPLMCG